MEEVFRNFSMLGIVSYGTYIPKFRIKLSEIARVWGKNVDVIMQSLGIKEKSVPAIDEDTATIAFEAGKSCLKALDRKVRIGALFIGSESHPYAVNPTSTIVGELLGIGNEYLAADLEFACKAATAGIQAIAGLVASNHIEHGLAIGADTAQSKPHDALEYSAASAGCAVILGKRQVIAELEGFTSFSSDTPDFWRRDGVPFPTHAGRFTGEPAYFTHVINAAEMLMKKLRIKPRDCTYCVFHMPNGKFPREAASRLGFRTEQLLPSMIVEDIGNPYSASMLLGLAQVLDQAKAGERIFAVSYGSGAGSDAFVWKATGALKNVQRKRRIFQSTVREQIKKKTYVSYAQYLKQTKKI